MPQPVLLLDVRQPGWFATAFSNPNNNYAFVKALR
jgi:hypothetical protein